MSLFNSLSARSPFESKLTYTPSTIAKKRLKKADFLLPHLVFIKFLTGRFDIVRHRSQQHVDIFAGILTKAFDNKDKISTHPLSRGTRFTLLRLAMMLLQTGESQSELWKLLLRQRVYECALAWFEPAPMFAFPSQGTSLTSRWSVFTTVKEIRAEIAIMVAFYKDVDADKRYIERAVRNSKYKDAQEGLSGSPCNM